MRLLPALVLLVLVFPLAAPAQTQGEMNQQAFADFTAADKKMNVVYNNLMKALPDDEAREKLKASQLAWLKYRDAEAALEADNARGGTMAPLLFSETKAALTTDRTAELKSVQSALN